MSGLIREHLDQLVRSFGFVKPPIDPTILHDLYRRKDFPAMLGWIKNSMRLDLRVGLRIVDAAGKSPLMSIETPRPMPPYGSAEFRRTRVVVNARRDVLESRPFAWVVAGFAHELSHVVLFSIGHPLQYDEKAVDLTAMMLGYQAFVTDAEVTTTEGTLLSALLAILLLPLGFLFWRGTSTRTDRIGYLTSAEARFARDYINFLAERRATAVGQTTGGR